MATRVRRFPYALILLSIITLSSEYSPSACSHQSFIGGVRCVSLEGKSRRRVVGGALSVALGLGLVVALPPAATTTASAAAPRQTSAPGTGNETLSEGEALAKAKRTGTDVEIVSLRGESSEVYATPDGKLEAREH